MKTLIKGKEYKVVGVELTGKSPIESPCRNCGEASSDGKDCAERCLFLNAFRARLTGEVSFSGGSLFGGEDIASAFGC